jgi:hypothetical protein
MWGKSISIRAPGIFMNGLKRKAGNAGGCFEEFSTYTTMAYLLWNRNAERLSTLHFLQNVLM